MTSSASTLPSSASGSRRALLVALTFGLLSAALVFAFLSSTRGGSAPVATVPVLVAAQDIALGDQITDQNVTLRQLPAAAKHPNAFTDTTRSTALNQVATEPIAAGEQVLGSQVTRNQAEVGLSALIPEGRRAVAVSVSDLSDGSLLRPGDYVDVVASFEANTNPPNSAVLALPKGDNQGRVYVAATVVQNVRVLAVGQTAVQPQVASGANNLKSAADAQAKNITLALTPDETQKVFLAEQIGTLRLAERRLGDTSVASVAPQDNSLGGLLAAAGQ